MAFAPRHALTARSSSSAALLLSLPLALGGCGDDGAGTASDTGGSSVTATTAGTTAATTAGGETEGASETGVTTAGSEGGTTGTTGATTTEGATSTDPMTSGIVTTGDPSDSATDTDTEGATTGAPVDECKVPEEELDGMAECDQEAPPDSFNPAVQWTWTGEVDRWSIVTPLVANLTDDNQDGEIDLCDTPDVVVLAYPQTSAPGYLYILDGETGVPHFKIEDSVHWGCSPALGDIDDDGVPEIVAYRNGALLAFEHDGQKKWEKPASVNGLAHAIALADVDNDGDVEIFVGNELFDHNGDLVATTGFASALSAGVLADLDGDGDQEIILTNAAYHHDGSQYYSHQGDINNFGYPQVANLDDDPEPEILIEAWDGISILEHDGAIKYLNEKPLPANPGDPWLRPSTVHDFDGDGEAEFAVSTGTQYAVYERDLSIIWTAPVIDASGDATGTAFDFLGDGIPEAMYGDEQNIHVFDGAGQTLFSEPRTSITHIEYPVVADIDNDGSAEILIVSNSFNNNSQSTIKAIRDAEDRWIQARRIWNQHTYHVTNVREDGTIPQDEQPSWQDLNTYRTNAQIEGGSICVPIPQ
ncbi:MAG: VCBS repeat-containing protein [Myxococcales bacterium]|nr:VCBS repeat-containing protein [Myxococcales bacterium]